MRFARPGTRASVFIDSMQKGRRSCWRRASRDAILTIGAECQRAPGELAVLIGGEGY